MKKPMILVVLVAAIVGGVLATSSVASPARTGAGVPLAPLGTSWIGIGRTVVAAPWSWQRRPGDLCGIAAGSGKEVTILSPVHAMAMCPMIEAPKPGYVRLTLSPRGRSNIDYQQPLRCSGQSCTAGHMFGSVVLSYSAYGPNARSHWRALLKSATTLSVGWTTVPYTGNRHTLQPTAAQEAAAVRRAGLRATVVGRGSSVHTMPAIGSPVRKGATVVITR